MNSNNLTMTTKGKHHAMEEMPWSIIESYFDGQHLTRCIRHQLESYNHFVNHEIQKTIDMFNPVTVHSEHDYNKEFDKYTLEMVITFSNFHIYRPQIHENNGATKLMFPQEARLRNFTYSSSMTVDLNVKIIRYFGDNLSQSETFHKTLPKIHIGKLPIMVKSDICVLKQYKHLDCKITGECYVDAGGYFIINGSEKIVIPQERAAENKVYCFNIKKNNNKWEWLAEIKSVPDHRCISPKQINMMIASRNSGFGHPMYIQIPRIKQPVPLFILFRALGINSDREICEMIVLDIDNEKMKKMLFGLKASIVQAAKYITKEEALDYIVNLAMYTPINMEKEAGERKKKEFTISVLENDLFPHCKTETQKKYFLGFMANKLLSTSFGWITPSDRDSYINKRIDLAGTLLNNLFRNYFNKLVKDMQKQIVREINNGSWKSTENYTNIINQTNVYKIVKSTTIENGIKRALATGDFGIKNTSSTKVGVAQVLNRLTYISALSHARRINTPIDKSGKLIPPRKLHNTQWGYICPAETPEGQPVGVVKNLSYMAHITIRSNSNPLYEIIEPFVVKIQDIPIQELFDKVKVLINGNWIGISQEPYELYLNLLSKKYAGIINIYTSVVFDYTNKEIRVCNEAGRPTRPLLKVKNNKLVITPDIVKKIKDKEIKWQDLLVNHVVDDSILEYIDPEEQNFAMIAMDRHKLTTMDKYNYTYTHCEIHPSTIFGILASCIPFPEHNQSPRNTYQCAMGKQAMGMYVTNFTSRMDKTAYILSYPMRPLVDTRLMNYIKLNRIPSGEVVMVAIMSYSGYNQEDSIIFNQGAIDRGMFAATIYHTEKDEDKKIHGDEEIRCRPDKTKTKGMKFGNYGKLNNKGVVPENTLIENKDIILGKVVPIKENRNDHTKVIKYQDQSKSYRANEECYIDKNYVNCNGDGYTFAKVRVRAFRKPVIGDKFSSRHGQKGTIGIILPEKDMPFDENGLRPDIIINPHAIPSRMTIGQLKETLLGSVLLELGLFGDGTSFNNFPVKDICKLMTKHGYEAHGNKILNNGMTGEQIETSVFYGPTFYQRLKHMVKDKSHARGSGPMVVLTRQPAEGRAREGGLRFGEMERDCMVSHGAGRFTKGRIYDCSDKFTTHCCKKCGMLAIYNDKKGIHLCKTCDNRTDFAQVNIPYACKLLFHELITMNIAPRIITD
jgi:DNA-directed RNA polymerase II subunit RPB2